MATTKKSNTEKSTQQNTGKGAATSTKQNTKKDTATTSPKPANKKEK